MAYNTFSPIVKDGLVLCLDAGNTKSYSGSGATWSDLTIIGNNGSLVGNPSFSSANCGSIAFNGSSTYATLQSKSVIGITSSFSLEYWSKLNTSTFMAWIHIGLQQVNNTFSIGMYSGSGTIITKFQKTVSNRCEYRFVSSPQLSAWEHYVITYDGSAVSTGFNLYKNSLLNNKSGGLAVDDYGAVTDSISNVGTIGYSASGTMGFLNGNISCFRIYNKILTSSEVLQNYNALKNRFI
jgi:hypothetical protein